MTNGSSTEPIRVRQEATRGPAHRGASTQHIASQVLGLPRSLGFRAPVGGTLQEATWEGGLGNTGCGLAGPEIHVEE